ncbi:endo-1,4-beta-xylanase [Reichenbachiella agariperforans]|uniref:endo-1,4-beta-xylanase n=1 Tax=Reichenbachiella agariperforans TaxID=156994 RepID=UPI001C09CB1E|nr:endo-1,4-beta-xylanase [Reichenbachiella agariperforans]MBU2913505.1 endo-1,4-beta-xylanase [Reichenbachiella agariperforans]
MNTKILSKTRVLGTLWLLFVLLFAHQVQSQSTEEWYDQAQERIDTLRRGEFGIEIYDINGQAYMGEVRVRMAKHEYPFGMSFDFYEGDIDTDVPTETQWMKAAMYKYFNYGVSGNSFKWSGIDPYGNGPDYTNFDHAVEWTQSVGWELRAHTLLWGGAEGDNHAMPQWVTNLGAAQAVYDECEDRIKREVTKYKGVIKEYDVINEPLHATYTQELYGDSLNWKSFIWAREADPDAELYVNDYNVEFGWGDADEYVTLINDMIDKGAPVTGVGLQAHFWDCCRPDINDFVTQVNKIAEVGLPMRLTEYDYGGDLTEGQQAEDFIKVATVAFSHPSINGMISWGLSDAGAWRENTGFFTADHTPKLAADTLLYLTQELWATNFDYILGGAETINFDAYYGDYRVEVKFGEKWKEFNIPLKKVNDGAVYELHEGDAELKALEFVQASLVDLNVLEVTFDQSIDSGTLDKADFRVFADNGVAINRVTVKEGGPTVLVFELDKQVSIFDYATLSYFPGTLAAETGATARAFGIEKIQIDSELNKVPEVENHTFHLAENALGGVVVGTVSAIDPEGAALSYKITAGNHLAIFGMNQESGEILLNNPFQLDREETPVHELTVQVSDGMNVVSVLVAIYLDKVLSVGTHAARGTLIYPNPTTNTLNIRSNDSFDQVSIFDLGGQLLYKETYGGLIQDTSLELDLDEGIYLLKLSNKTMINVSRVIVRSN